jgi:hypothetical protein
MPSGLNYGFLEKEGGERFLDILNQAWAIFKYLRTGSVSLIMASEHDITH